MVRPQAAEQRWALRLVSDAGAQHAASALPSLHHPARLALANDSCTAWLLVLAAAWSLHEAAARASAYACAGQVQRRAVRGEKVGAASWAAAQAPPAPAAPRTRTPNSWAAVQHSYCAALLRSTMAALRPLRCAACTAAPACSGVPWPRWWPRR